MPDPTSFIPERLKEKLADSLVELLAGSAERLGGDQVADSIRTLSSRGDLLHSVNLALKAGIERFITEYMSQDEDLVEAIRADKLFWQSKMVQDALVTLVSRPGAWLREERETVVYHFETVLPQRVNRDRVDRAVSFLLRCIAEQLWSLPGAQEIREAYSIQFQELSAEAQREGVALARQQLRAITQMNADLRQALLQLIGLVEQRVLAGPAPVAMLESPRPYHNLPQPTYTQFVGRDEELAWLKQRLSPSDRAWQIAVTGIGGVGKSAIALAIAHEYRQRYAELPPEERFEAIVWVSAKEEVLTAFGRERASVPDQVLHTLEDIYTAIARVLEREDITRAQPSEQSTLVDKALKRQRLLLLMDNLESVRDDRIKAFLRNLPAPTKAIITSRESLNVADVRPLTGLLWKEAESLIEAECQAREVSLTEQQRKRVFELTSGLPLPIKLAVARMAGGESFVAVERWLGDAVGELPEYCVKGQIELVKQRDPNAWIVLAACSLFDREAGASREALGFVADLSLADRDAALAHLQRLFLVNRTEGDRFWAFPIVQRFVSVALSDANTVRLLLERRANWLADFASAWGITATAEAATMSQLGLEYPNLRMGLQWCIQEELHRLVLRLVAGIWPYAYRVALFTDLKEMGLSWLHSAQITDDECGQGQALLQLARLYWNWESDVETIAYLNRADPILEKWRNYGELAEAWSMRSQIYRWRCPEKALVFAQKTLDLGERLSDPDMMASACTQFARIERARQNFEKASAWLDQAEMWAEQHVTQRTRSHVLYNRAVLLILTNRHSEAEPLLLEAHSLDVEMGERRYIAMCKYRLAQIYAATGRVNAARQLAEESRHLVEALDMKGFLAVVNQLEAELR